MLSHIEAWTEERPLLPALRNSGRFLTIPLRLDLTFDCANCDSLFIEICLKSSKLIVGVINKPDYVIFLDFLQYLSSTLSVISDEMKTCYLMGDFNLNLLSHLSDPHVRDFLNLFYFHDFITCIGLPTRIKTDKHTSVSLIIDNILQTIFLNYQLRCSYDWPFWSLSSFPKKYPFPCRLA